MEFFHELFDYETFLDDEGTLIIGCEISPKVYFIYGFFIPKHRRKGLDRSKFNKFCDYLRDERDINYVTGSIIIGTNKWSQRLRLHIKYLGYEITNITASEIILRKQLI